ncbi:MAG: Re/Si-specific NAD(P)(+) transhydrogenase subunit alpha [Pseudomonadota bacterium]|nr:Re/Si-specific NAD(P)(+) transhydrogenase subunit alpha [Pseudomonadota bacterium]
MNIGIPRETFPGERRVAATPESTERLRKLGFTVALESGAGAGAGLADEAYAGVELLPDAAAVWAQSDIVLKVRPPTLADIAHMRKGQVVLSLFWPAQNSGLLEAVAARGVTLLAMDQVPRITRAQKLDVLSSQANLVGYRAVIEAANRFGRFFTGQVTAAGKVTPAKVLIIGAGVAGLSAVGTARALGAIVRAFDTRPAVREQVQSLGAEFIEVTLEEDGAGVGGYAKEMSPAFIAAEMALFLQQAREVDIIVTTALIPGKPAPLLITEEMVEAMRPGSVIVDLAAEQGGNCALTRPGEVVVHNLVSIIGYTDLPSRMAVQASQLFGTNLCHLLDDMGGAAKFNVDLADEVVRAMTVTHDGAVTWPPPPFLAAAVPKVLPAATPTAGGSPSPAVPANGASAKATLASTPSGRPNATQKAGSHAGGHGKAGSHGSPRGNSNPVGLFVAGAALLAVGLVAPPAFLTHLLVFVLACFIGWQVVWNVTPALHTPLMSVTNAISGIILLGGMVQLGTGGTLSAASVLGAIAILLATINVAGGFLVTQRMLRMFVREG